MVCGGYTTSWFPRIVLCSLLVLSAKFSLTVHRTLGAARPVVDGDAVRTVDGGPRVPGSAPSAGYSVRAPPVCRTPDPPEGATNGSVRGVSFRGDQEVSSTSTPFALQVTVSLLQHYVSSLV